jgi:hypothetical protein
MKNGRYIINRDDIYVGQVIDTSSISKESDCKTLCAGPYCELRTMLFVLTKEKLAEDLLYDSKNYPVLNITKKDVLNANMVNTKHGTIVIQKACNLGKLLKFYGYDEKLNMFDIIKIRKTILSKDFAYEHCEDFGYHKLGNDMGYGSFNTSNPFFELFDVLNELNGSLETRLKDSFMPRLSEGKVRKLIRPKGESIPTTK